MVRRRKEQLLERLFDASFGHNHIASPRASFDNTWARLDDVSSSMLKHVRLKSCLIVNIYEG